MNKKQNTGTTQRNNNIISENKVERWIIQHKNVLQIYKKAKLKSKSNILFDINDLWQKYTLQNQIQLPASLRQKTLVNLSHVKHVEHKRS